MLAQSARVLFEIMACNFAMIFLFISLTFDKSIENEEPITVLNVAATTAATVRNRRHLEEVDNAHNSRVGEDLENRRFFSWFQNVFKQKHLKLDKISTTEHSNLSIIPLKKHDQQNLIAVLNRLESVLRKISENMPEKNRKVRNFMDNNTNRPSRRFKRYVSGNDSDVTTGESFTNVTCIAVGNDFGKQCQGSKENEDGRSYYTDEERSSSGVNSKLSIHINDNYNEILKNLESIHDIKHTISNEENYKIGYLIANIDTLELNLKRLKAKVDENESFWDDTVYFNVLTQLKDANKVISELEELLRKRRWE